MVTINVGEGCIMNQRKKRLLWITSHPDILEASTCDSSLVDPMFLRGSGGHLKVWRAGDLVGLQPHIIPLWELSYNTLPFPHPLLLTVSGNRSALLLGRTQFRGVEIHITCLICVVAVVQSLSRTRLCDPMDCNTPRSSALHYLPELAQIHVR